MYVRQITLAQVVLAFGAGGGGSLEESGAVMKAGESFMFPAVETDGRTQVRQEAPTSGRGGGWVAAAAAAWRVVVMVVVTVVESEWRESVWM